MLNTFVHRWFSAMCMWSSGTVSISRFLHRHSFRIEAATQRSPMVQRRTTPASCLPAVALQSIASSRTSPLIRSRWLVGFITESRDRLRSCLAATSLLAESPQPLVWYTAHHPSRGTRRQQVSTEFICDLGRTHTDGCFPFSVCSIRTENFRSSLVRGGGGQRICQYQPTARARARQFRDALGQGRCQGRGDEVRPLHRGAERARVPRFIGLRGARVSVFRPVSVSVYISQVRTLRQCRSFLYSPRDLIVVMVMFGVPTRFVRRTER